MNGLFKRNCEAENDAKFKESQTQVEKGGPYKKN